MFNSPRVPNDPFSLDAQPALEETFSPPVQGVVNQLLDMERGPDPSDLDAEDRHEAERWLLRALSELSESEEDLPPAVEARALVYHGRILKADGNLAEAEDALTEAHDLFRTLRAMPWQAEALYYRGLSRLADQRFRAAGADLEQARRLWTKAGQPKRALTAMNAKATMQFFQGEFEAAQQLYQRILAQSDAEDTDTELAVRHNLATIAYELGDPEASVKEYKAVLAILEDREMRTEIAKCRQNLGAAYVSMERYDDGINEMDIALSIYRDTGNRYGEAETMHNKAFLLQEISRLKEAYELFRETLTLRQEIDDEAGQGMTLAQLGILAADDLGRPEPGLKVLCAGQALLDEALDWRAEQVANWVLDVAGEQGISNDELDVIWKESEDLYFMDMGQELLADAFPEDTDWMAASKQRASLLEAIGQYVQDLALRYPK